jgi:acetyltransferase-like isoleucine patch superfamily enzyme
MRRSVKRFSFVSIMRWLLRKFKSFVLIIIKGAMPLFYNRRYLRGRYFDEARIGWVWALHGIWWQKILGFNRHVPWPVHPIFRISNPAMIEFDVDDMANFQSFGCYFQNFSAPIYIGKGTKIAPNVGIITANHDISDPELHDEGRPVRIGQKCWIGMNSVILPGVTLGDHTTVGAGSVVTRSFPLGNCVIAGSPARVIRQLDRD